MTLPPVREGRFSTAGSPDSCWCRARRRTRSLVALGPDGSPSLEGGQRSPGHNFYFLALHHRWLHLLFLSALCPSDFVSRAVGTRGKSLNRCAGSPCCPAVASLWGLDQPLTWVPQATPWTVTRRLPARLRALPSSLLSPHTCPEPEPQPCTSSVRWQESPQLEQVAKVLEFLF